MKAARPFLTSVGVCAAICLAAPAHADNTDNAFLQQLDGAGIEYADAQDAISIGKGVCDLLGQGQPPTTVVRSLKISNHHLSVHMAAQFVAISAQTYCPTQLAADSVAS